LKKEKGNREGKSESQCNVF